jgi:hypothetical protein
MIQESFHFGFPFQDFFFQIIVLCNDVWAFFKFKFEILAHTLVSTIAYLVAFDMALSKHNLTNRDDKSRGEHKTTLVNALVKVHRLKSLFSCK